MDELNVFLQHPLVVATAVSVYQMTEADWAVFDTFKSFEQAAQYDWKVFAFRVTKGVIKGVLGYFGVLGAVSSASSLVW